MLPALCRALDFRGSQVSDPEDAPTGGSLLPLPRLIAGLHFVTVDIERIGLKDADTYVDPTVSVSVFGACLPPHRANPRRRYLWIFLPFLLSILPALLMRSRTRAPPLWLHAS